MIVKKNKINKSTTNQAAIFTVLSGLACELQAPLKLTTLTAHQLVEIYKKKNFEYISYKDFQQLLQTMEQICRHLKRCCLITDRMMDLHQDKTNIAAKDTDINGIIRSIFNLYKQQLKDRHIKPRLMLAKALPTIPISTIQIHQVVQHVLLNAIQSMPNGGSLFVSTSLADQGRVVAIEVRDQGVGIDPEHLLRIYEPFFTTKERGVEKSSGLGLSVAYSIINALGGTIDIKSSLRKGTRVYITLPVVK